MKFRMLTLTLLFALSGAFYGCADSTHANRAANEMVAETENAIADLGAEIERESDEFATNFENAQDAINKRKQAIEDDMKTASDDAKEKLQEEWNQLEAWSNDIDDRMSRVGDNMERGWKEFTGDVKDGWKSFSKDSERLLKEIEQSLDPEGDLE